MSLSFPDLRKTAEKFRGQKTAVLCSRYQYRGVVTEVFDDHLVLANATMVEVSGIAMGERPQTEDPLGGSVNISFFSIEIIYQPPWVNAPLPGEA